jgi:hypothetical protein
MILEQETLEAYGYYPSDLKPQSCKSIIAACELCGEFRITSKNDYHYFCSSCSKKGKYPSKETKTLLSAANKGNTNCLGYKHTEETKAKHRKAMKGKRLGKNNPHYKGGKKVAKARGHAKRQRQLGYTPLMPLEDGEDGHHVTNEYVIGVPTKVHQSFNGHSRKKHRTLVLQWLKLNDKKKYKMVLCVLAKE